MCMHCIFGCCLSHFVSLFALFEIIAFLVYLVCAVCFETVVYFVLHYFWVGVGGGCCFSCLFGFVIFVCWWWFVCFGFLWGGGYFVNLWTLLKSACTVYFCFICCRFHLLVYVLFT